MYYLVSLSLLVLAGTHVSWVKGVDVDQAFDKLLDMGVSFVLGQASEDNGVAPDANKQFLVKDKSNEHLTKLSVQELLARSGFKHEDHFVTAPDGYISNLIRVINPLADRGRLKQPPVMMLHGGLIDSTVWVWSSAIQHHPEKWPRTLEEDGPMTSWNKSLGFVLANNGYDVWICGTRGSNIYNKGHTRLKNHFNWFDREQLANMTSLSERLRPGEPPVKMDLNFKMNFGENLDYWNYTMDELVRYEVPGQQQYIMEVTGAQKLSLIDLSISTLTDLALMSDNPQFTSKLHNYVTLAPILNNRGTNRVIKYFHATVCQAIPDHIGIVLYQVVMSPLVRSFVEQFNSIKQLRYSIVKQLTRIISGPSAKYSTNLDSGVVGHILESTGFKHTKQYCQQAHVGRLQKYDYGQVENKRIYGSNEPPIYDVSQIDFPDWMLVSAGNDKAATISSVNQLLASVKRQPSKRVHVKQYNHLDLIAGFENDKYVNLPVLEFLDQFAFVAAEGRPSSPESKALDDSLRSVAGRAESVIKSIEGIQRSQVNDNDLLDSRAGGRGRD